MFKNIFLVICFIFAAESFACENYEAQFIGKVESTQVVADGCLVKLSADFTYYAVHGFCPLYDVDLVNLGLLTKNCDYKVDQQISGVAVLNVNQSYPVLED